MMLHEFMLLKEPEQFKVLEECGIIASRRNIYNKYFLYQINDFYVEVRFTNKNVVIGLKSFVTTNLLEPYLDKINITGIYNIE